MLRGGDAAVGSDEHMIAKPNLGPVRDHKIVVGVKEIPHKNMIAVITPEGRGKYHIFAHASQQIFQDFLLTIPVIGTEPVKLMAFLLAISDFLFQFGIVACLKQAVKWNFRSVFIHNFFSLSYFLPSVREPVILMRGNGAGIITFITGLRADIYVFKMDRKSGGMIKAFPVLDLKMQMRFRAVAGITAVGNRLSPSDALSFFYLNAARH
jgi:hypothetical protein